MSSMYKLQWEPKRKLQFQIVLCHLSQCYSLVPTTNFLSFGIAFCFSLKTYIFSKQVWIHFTKPEQELSGCWGRGWDVLQRGVPSTKKTRKKAHRENNVEGIKVFKGHLIYQSWCYQEFQDVGNTNIYSLTLNISVL